MVSDYGSGGARAWRRIRNAWNSCEQFQKNVYLLPCRRLANTVITIAKEVCCVPGSNTGERHTLWRFPFSGEETQPCTDEVTNISWPEVAKPGLDHLVSNYRSSSLGC